jgi:hypothetical protein
VLVFVRPHGLSISFSPDRASLEATACGRAPLGATVAAVEGVVVGAEEHVADRASLEATACGRAPLGATVAAFEELEDAACPIAGT